jgi:hypothetical protein
MHDFLNHPDVTRAHRVEVVRRLLEHARMTHQSGLYLSVEEVEALLPEGVAGHGRPPSDPKAR